MGTPPESHASRHIGEQPPLVISGQGVASVEFPVAEQQFKEPEGLPVETGSPQDVGAAGLESQDLERLRSLLFQREIALIDELRSRLSDHSSRTGDVSDVLAEALVLRAGKDERLQLALAPMVEDIFKTSLRRNPRGFSEVLFPLMGPSIRKSIAEAFRGMLEGFNKSIEMSFSWKGLRWRFEALRTGRPFSEIVLLHTLVYRVEEVYFIHSATGIDIAHVINEGVDSNDSSMISAMLTAIQDFVQDCFAGGQGNLESLRHGEYTVLLEKDERAYLACVVRGSPPVSFQAQIQACLENLLVEFAEPLAAFSGDTAPFAFADRHLEQLLVAHYLDEKKPLSMWVKALPIVLLLVIAGVMGNYKYQQYEAEALRIEEQLAVEEKHRQLRSEQEAALDVLRAEPGLLISNVAQFEGDTPREVLCLKDLLAKDPLEVLEKKGLSPAGLEFRIIPFVSYHQNIVERRIRESIHPPNSVSLRFDDSGCLYFSGTAPMHWILKTRQEAMALPGVKRVDMSNLSDPRMEQIAAMRRQVESIGIQFPMGSDTPTAADVPRLSQAMDALVALEKLAAEMGVAVSLTIYGHADATGHEKRNYEISQARAKTVAAMLYARGSSMPVAIYGLGADYANKEGNGRAADSSSRRIEMRVRLTQAGDATPEVLRQDE